MDSQEIYLRITHKSSNRQAYKKRKEVQELRSIIKNMQFITFCKKIDELAIASDGPSEEVQDRFFRYLILLKDPCAPYDWFEQRDRRPWDQSPIFPPNIIKYNLNKENYVRTTIENATLFEKLAKNQYFKNFTNDFLSQELEKIVAPFKNNFASAHLYATNPQSIHEPIPEVACLQNNISRTRSNSDISYHGVSNSSGSAMQASLKVIRIENTQENESFDPEQQNGMLQEQKGLENQTRRTLYPLIAEGAQTTPKAEEFSQADKIFGILDQDVAPPKLFLRQKSPSILPNYKKHRFNLLKFYKNSNSFNKNLRFKNNKIFNINKCLKILSSNKKSLKKYFSMFRKYGDMNSFSSSKQLKSPEFSRQNDFPESRKIFRLHYTSLRKKRYKIPLYFIRQKDDNPYKNFANTLRFQSNACKSGTQTSIKWLQRKRRKRKIIFNHNRRKTFAKVNQIVCDKLDRQQRRHLQNDFTQQKQPSNAVSRILAQNLRIALKAKMPCFRIKNNLSNKFYLGKSNPVLKSQPRQTEPRIAWLNIIFI